jgi:hypothetical protein
VLQLFLSYASQDADRARRFSTDLRRPGIEPWMDDELKERVESCDFFLLLLSRATQEVDPKRFFPKEWRLAHKARRATAR